MAKNKRFSPDPDTAFTDSSPLSVPGGASPPAAAPVDPAALFRRPAKSEVASLAALIGVGDATAQPAGPHPAAVAPTGSVSANAQADIYAETPEDLAALRPGAVAHIALHLIVENPSNARYFYSSQDVDRTAMSMSEKKQLAIATGWVDGGKLFLKDGQMRWRGARASGLSHLKVEVIPKPEPLDAYLSSREMNTARSEQTCLDDAVRWKQLLGDGTFQDQAHIAASLGISVPTVSRTLSISTIPVRLLSRMREHKITSSLRVAVEIARLFADTAPKSGGRELSREDLEVIAEEVIEEAVKKELSGDNVRRLIDSRLVGPKSRTRSDIRPIKVGELTGQIKTVADRGQLEFSIRGLPIDRLEKLTQAIEAAVQAA